MKERSTKFDFLPSYVPGCAAQSFSLFVQLGARENRSGAAIRIDESSRGWSTKQSKCINLRHGHTFPFLTYLMACLPSTSPCRAPLCVVRRSARSEIITQTSNPRPIISSHQHLALLCPKPFPPAALAKGRPFVRRGRGPPSVDCLHRINTRKIPEKMTRA